eukprot:gene7549-9046_t
MANFATSTAADQIPANEAIDHQYPGTAVARMLAARNRIRSLTYEQLNGDWEDVRRNLLWAGGLRDLVNVPPGQGYTGHSFNDFNHCDLTAMQAEVADADNNGQVAGIAVHNPLGAGIVIASLPELGPGGSWTTCMMGCQHEPPRDVAHVQFRARIAFKLVWAPPRFATFVIVDDDGVMLAQGRPTGTLPHEEDRVMNYRLVRGSKYATAADQLAAEQTMRSNISRGA